MEKNVKISMLLEMYGALLTEKQFNIIDLYYNQNLSLSEIGDDIEITRQAVRKSLVEGEKNLFSFEKKLGFLEEKIQRNKYIDELLQVSNEKKICEILEKLR